MHNSRKDSPSFHRNIGPIGEKLTELFASSKFHVLEIGSGSGQHTHALAGMFPAASFQPTDADAENLGSIDAWNQPENSENVAPARLLDVTNPGHHFNPQTPFDVILCFNVIHIAPWAVTEGLFELAKKSQLQTRMLFSTALSGSTADKPVKAMSSLRGG